MPLCLPLHKSGALTPVCKLFKQPLYIFECVGNITHQLLGFYQVLSLKTSKYA